MASGTEGTPAARLRAIPGFDADTGALVRVALTDRPPRRGAGVSVLEPRPDLDAAVPTPRGWHWRESSEGELLCELAPTDAEVLAQVAEDLERGTFEGYRVPGDAYSAEGLRETAEHRMGCPAGEADHWCALLLRRYEEHRRAEEEKAGP